ncbi:LysM peptidoglycan-binding domain-containing protein [Rhizobium sp. YJ-22]|uniref:LysM peptidoglycan-binding domain-containing protein n=1 Tax=Rhizobium sp. YJ-22 TaxID=3037556 RepID=UPI002412763F|nr:LysM peptidoglycan-binding domain-containing protein [Rhizobium sp. YJ-22]MDG3577298.1 LysM peptidoglycan-binding domain-containing protein [Rhizobium sp. YJ-22]
MKNRRAGLLALLVVVAATLLMVFFVLPRIGNDDKAKETASKPAPQTETAAQQPPEPAAPAAIDAAKLTGTLNGLSKDALAAIGTLKTLFSAATAPDAKAVSEAKAKSVDALQAVADFALPQGLDTTAAAPLNLIRDGARKGLDLLKTLPDAPADALKVLAEIESALTGKPVAAPADAAASAKTDRPSAAAASDETMPAFDVLRVEPDGSTVIAGRAAPNSKIEIISGDKVVSSVDVGASGDFAAILDAPLPAGDHQLVLKATAKDGKSVISQEVATVSIPQDKSGELLAMVTKPGEASRIITAPDEVAAKPQAPANGAATPELPAASGDLASTAPAVSTNGTAAPQPTNADNADAQLRVTAVEIEGSKIFVAGIAASKANVAGYADDKPIGKATAAAEGHFVIEGMIDLDVGDHTIRVDMLDAAGKVAVRASVPFTRPAGNQVSVVAQPGNAAGIDAASLDPAFRKLHSDLSTALGLLRNLFAGGQLPAGDALAAARSATEIALKSLSDFQAAPDSTAGFKEIAAKTSASAAKALTALQALPRDAKAFGASLEILTALIDDTLRLAPQATSPAVAQAPQPTAQAQADAGAEAAGAPVTISQAPLTQSNESVIIRRGDTLWQISRRVYGAGVRYTTIYLANRQQINNPDRIRPGQIFGLPKDARPDSEELHRKRLHGDSL